MSDEKAVDIDKVSSPLQSETDLNTASAATPNSPTLTSASPAPDDEAAEYDDDEDDDDDEDEDGEYDDDEDDDDDEEYEDDADEDDDVSQFNQADLYAQLTSNPLFAQVSQMLGGLGSQTDQMFTQARMLQAAGDLEGAAQLYLDVIEQHPDHFKAHEALGQVLLAMDKPQEAEVFLRKAIELDPNDPSGYLYLGYAHYAQEQYNLCVDDFKRSVELDQQNPLAANNLGYAYYLTNQLDEAAATFTQAGDWGSDRAYYNLGMIRLLQGQDKEATQAYQDAADLDPHGKQIEDHLDDLTVAAEKHPDCAAALTAQANQLRQKL